MLRRPRRKVIALATVLAALAIQPTPGAAQANCDPATNESMRERKVRCPEQVLRVSCGGDIFDLEGAVCCLIDRTHPVTAYCGTSGETINLKCRGATHSVMIEPTQRGLSYNCLATAEIDVTPDPDDPPDGDGGGDSAGTANNADAGPEPSADGGAAGTGAD
ncbi:MAG: hypothetical protein AAF409_19510 [Pseudomonadota bacterium]